MDRHRVVIVLLAEEEIPDFPGQDSIASLQRTN